MTKKQAKILEEYVAKMLEYEGLGDPEVSHSAVDGLLLEVVRQLGFGQLADAWEAVAESERGFWYA